MDYASSLLFSDQDNNHIDDLFQFSSSNNIIPSSSIEHDKTLLTPCEEEEDGKDHNNTPKYGRRRRKLSITFGVANDQNPNEKKKQKIIHRDIERQRRQEMATLYTSLRTLLPFERLKGKRSISDHIHEAANYIKHTEDKIQKLTDKREELKRILHKSCNTASCGAPKSTKSCQQDIVRVKSCWEGVEVSINTALTDGVPLSSVFQILIKGGLNILCCTSNKVNDRLIYNIKAEVSEGRSIGPAELQQRLTILTK